MSSGITIGVAGGRECVDACAVFVPFVLPEVFEGAGVGEPVFFHVGEEGGVAGAGDYGGYVVVLGGRGAELVVGAVAEVGP